MENHIAFSHYTPNILLGKDVIIDMLSEMIDKNRKVLIFGLGYDSKIWHTANNSKNIWFVESNQTYIDLNNYIHPQNIIKCDYQNISVKKSFTMQQCDIDKYEIPNEILLHAPYDLILIDAPTGYNDDCPGRLLPIYWSSKLLSHQNTIIYIDDTERKLENYCVSKFMQNFGFKKLFLTTTFNRQCVTLKLVRL